MPLCISCSQPIAGKSGEPPGFGLVSFCQHACQDACELFLQVPMRPILCLDEPNQGSEMRLSQLGMVATCHSQEGELWQLSGMKLRGIERGGAIAGKAC